MDGQIAGLGVRHLLLFSKMLAREKERDGAGLVVSFVTKNVV